MKIYFREIEGHLESIHAGKSFTFEAGLVRHCEKSFGPSSSETWMVFRPPRSNRWTHPEGINFINEEFATAFCLVYRKCT